MIQTKLPFHHHLKWLLLEGLSGREIQKYYDNIQLPTLAQGHFDHCQDYVDSLPLAPLTLKRLRKKLYNEVDHALWKKLGFEEIYLHRMDKSDWSELGKVLNHPVMRVAMECCLIKNLEDSEIATLLPATFALPLTAKTVALHRKYFFDVNTLQRNDWQEYLNLISDDRYTYTRLFAALTKPKDEVLHMVGLPTKTKFGTMLKNVMATAHYKFEYYARQMSPEAQAEARNWAKVLIVAGEKHEKFGAGDDGDLSNILQTEFVYVDEPIEHVTPEMLSDAKPQLLNPGGEGPEKKTKKD